MLQNPTVGYSTRRFTCLCNAQAITSFTTRHTHAYQSTASLVANSALAWLQAKPSRSLEDGKWEMGDRGMRILKVSKQGRRPRPTDRVHPCRNKPNSHSPSPISQFPFALALCFTPTKPVIWGRTHTHTHTLGSMFNSVSGTDRQTLSIRGTQVTTAASIAVAALHFLHS